MRRAFMFAGIASARGQFGARIRTVEQLHRITFPKKAAALRESFYPTDHEIGADSHRVC